MKDNRFMLKAAISFIMANVKGLFHTDDLTYVIVNDCHYNFCGEKSIPISDFHHLIMNGHQYYIGAIAP